MTLTHHSQILAALIGVACLSCAGSDAREDNEAPPAFQPRHEVGRWEPPPPPPPAFEGRWREAPHSRVIVPTRAHGGPTYVVRSQDRQSGPLLGVSVESSNDGLRVTEVQETSVAGSAGVKTGDVLLRVGDEHIDTVGDVRHALAGKRPGDQVKVAVIRAGEGIVELTGTVPEAPAGTPEADDAAGADLFDADGSRGGFLGVQLHEEEQPGDAERTAPDATAPDAAAPDAQATPGAPGVQPTPPADTGPGVLVDGVVPNTAAWFAGIEAQDRLLSIDGKPVETPAEVAGAVSSKEPGTFVELKYQRGGEERSARVRLGQRPMRGLFGTQPSLGPQGLGGQQLEDMLDLHGGPGRMRFDLPRMPDMSRMMVEPGAMHSLRVQIDGDRMTVERDGQTEHYMRGPDGDWVLESAPASEGSRA